MKKSFATNSDVLIFLSWQANVGDLKYFKQKLMLDKIIQVSNIKGLHHQVAKKSTSVVMCLLEV